MGGGQLMNGPNLAPTGYMSSQSRPMLQVSTVQYTLYTIIYSACTNVQRLHKAVHSISVLFSAQHCTVFTGLPNCSSVHLHSNVTV